MPMIMLRELQLVIATVIDGKACRPTRCRVELVEADGTGVVRLQDGKFHRVRPEDCVPDGDPAPDAPEPHSYEDE